MKKVLGVLTALLLGLVTANAQTLCVTTVDVCCNSDFTANSATTTSAENAWKLDYQAASSTNQLTIYMQVDGIDVQSWTVCGCGSVTFNYAVNPNHSITLKIRCGGCDVQECTKAESKAALYSNVPNSVCKLTCD